VRRGRSRCGGRVFRLASVFLVGLGFFTAACGGGSSSSTTSPSSTPTTSSQPTTETFSGTVSVQGCGTNNFNVNQSGELDVTLTSASPPPNIVMQLGVGTQLGATCSLISTVNTAAGPASTLGGQAAPGAFCVSVCDAGNQTGNVNYTVSVVHH